MENIANYHRHYHRHQCHRDVSSSSHKQNLLFASLALKTEIS